MNTLNKAQNGSQLNILWIAGLDGNGMDVFRNSYNISYPGMREEIQRDQVFTIF